MSGSTKHSWLSAEDDIVRQKLSAALRHAQGDLSPLEILGSPGPGQARVAFLNITKTYHPNRFARRPEDIRRLANDVYILLKEAYDKVKIGEAELEREAADKRLRDAKTKAAAAAKELKKAAPSKAAQSAKAALPDPAVLATRRAMMNRRKEELAKKGIGGGTGKRTAQVRAATDPNNAQSDKEKRAEEEVSFKRALNQIRITDFETAAANFKELAVGRPSEKRYRMHMHYAQGRLHQSLGNYDEARAEYKRALGLDANFAEAHQAMETLPGGESAAKSLLKKFFKK